MITTEALRRLAETSAAYVAEESNDNYGPYLLHQAAIAWGDPAVVAEISAELMRLRALHAAVVEWRAKLNVWDGLLQQATSISELPTAMDASQAETKALVALDAALKECG